jgi:hypothetical protein
MTKIFLTLSLLCASVAAQASSPIGAFNDTANPNTPGTSNPSLDPVVEWNRTLLVIVRTPGAQSATVHPK